jgi:hypothetical protein
MDYIANCSYLLVSVDHYLSRRGVVYPYLRRSFVFHEDRRFSRGSCCER